MSSDYSNMFGANFIETSPNTTYGDQSFDDNAFSSQGYQGNIVYYPTPSYYYVYNVVTPVEMNGATFYYYSAYAVPFYSVSFDDMASASNIAADIHTESPDYGLASLFQEQDSVSSVSFDDMASASNIAADIHFESPDYALASLFEEQDSLSSVSFDDMASASNIAADIHTESPDYGLASLFQEQDNIYSVSFDDMASASNIAADIHFESPDYALASLFEEQDSLSSVPLDEVSFASSIATDMYLESPDYGLDSLFQEQDSVYSVLCSGELMSKEPVVDVIPLNGEEEMLDSTNASLEFSCEDVFPQSDKCHGDYDKEFGNDAVVKLLSDSMNENTSQKESSEGSVDNWEFLQDLAFDNVEDQEFKIEASYCGPSENDLLGQPSYNDLEEDAFNSPFPSRKVFKKLRYFKREIEVLPTIYEEDESPEDDVELPELELPIDEVESSKNPKKKRFKRLRRWFSQLTSCCRKNKKPPD